MMCLYCIVLGVLFFVIESFGVMTRSEMNAVNSIEKTMLTMQSDIKSWGAETRKIGAEVNQIKKNFDDSEDKAKIDFRIVWKDFITSRWTLIFGGLGLLIYFILQAIANIDMVSLLKLLGK